MSGDTSSPLITKRGRCRSPGVSSKLSNSTTPGTRCIVFLRRCLAIQLQKVGQFPSNLTTSYSNNNIENTTLERDAPLYWMYDSGYLIFQGFLEANLKCFWNGALMEAMKVLEFQGYIAPGVLLVSGSPCALEVIRAAWARNVLRPPNNYVITIVGDVEDCLVEPISQGQFTPLPEALCWVILDMTASGYAAVMESICSTLEVTFPDMQKPSKQVVYDTLAKLTEEKKLYQTSNGYFIMTPDKMRLSGFTTIKESCDNFIGIRQKQVLLTPDEAVVMIHGEIETRRDGNVTHQAIQTNLADVICGGNLNDKIIYPRIPSRIRSGYSTERLERRHSLRFFGHTRRSHSLQRTGSVRHISDKNEKIQNTKDEPNLDDVSRKHTSLFSRLFRRSGRMKKIDRDEPPSNINKPTFSAQFPPSEWFNRGVTHLHSVGTQTTYLAPNTDTLPKRNFNYDSDDVLLQDVQQKRRISTFGTPRTIRRTSHSATLPRRTLKKISHYSGVDKNINSRNSSQISVAQNPMNDVCVTSRTSSHSSLSSSKTVISKEQSKRTLPTHKSLSSTSSGYNSLPRSSCSGMRNSKAATKSNTKLKSKIIKERPESSFTFHVSAKSSAGFEGDTSNTSTKTETNATTMTTTINNGNTTKIFVQQHNTPTCSLITFENSVDQNDEPDVIIMNQPHDCKNNESSKETKNSIRPSSLYTEQNNLCKSNRHSAKVLETQLKMKYPSTETIQLEEKSLEVFNKDKKINYKSNINVLDDLSSVKNAMLKNNDNIFSLNSETGLNNVKNYLLSQNSNVEKINNLRNKNLLKNFNDDDNKIRDSPNSEPASPSIEHNVTKFNELKKLNDINIEKELGCLNLDDTRLKHYPDFPSLSDLSLRFTSLAAQSILKGVNYNSVDTLVEVNMAAEKKRNCEMNITTDLGMV